MKKTMCFFFILSFFLSCSRADAQPTPDNFSVRTNLIGFSPEQELKVKEAARLIKRIVRSHEFKDAVLNHTWNGKKTFAENDGLSNADIYKKILEGSERQSHHGVNFTMDIELELYADFNSYTIGYTYPSISRIYMNKKYLNKFQTFQVADNMMHEWLHKLGFNHAIKKTPERQYSVPYAIGYIIEDLAAKDL